MPDNDAVLKELKRLNNGFTTMNVSLTGNPDSSDSRGVIGDISDMKETMAAIKTCTERHGTSIQWLRAGVWLILSSIVGSVFFVLRSFVK